ncbi:hypothetical protein [Bacillus cihuensis]|uniref:hypothetical protein n=1 Tax=Bacillus cihuensis TaxID=1208599 RepID=UPI000491BE68|nr:hypothetical protein [Bacillus cihuensis]
MYYKLLIDCEKSLDCLKQQEEGVIYTARTLSKYSHCQVDVYLIDKKINRHISSFINGKPNIIGVPA